MQYTVTIFVVEIVSCFLDVFFKSPKFTSLLHGPQRIPLFQSNYILSNFDFCYVPAMGQYTRGGGRKPELREGRRNERHKRSEKIQEK